METTFRFIRNDLKVTWRDSSARIFLLLPVVFFLLLQTAIPSLLAAYPVVLDYGAYLLGAFTFQGGLMFGFVSGFLLLDEKDQDIFSVFQVAPMSLERLLTMKISFPFLGAFFYGVLTLAFNPIHRVGGLDLVLLPLCFALICPLVALWVGALGRNKVEGLTWFKAIDLVLIVPLLGFFLPGNWEYVFAVVPSYYAFKGVEVVELGGNALAWELIGLGLGTALVAVSVWFFKRRM